MPHFIFAIIEKQWNVYLWNDISSSNVDVYIHIDHIHNYCVRRTFRFAPTFFLKPSEKCVLLGSKNNKVLEFAFRLFVSGIISNKMYKIYLSLIVLYLMAFLLHINLLAKIVYIYISSARNIRRQF